MFKPIGLKIGIPTQQPLEKEKLLSLDLMFSTPSVDLGLNGEAAPIINPQVGNHVEKDATL